MTGTDNHPTWWSEHTMQPWYETIIDAGHGLLSIDPGDTHCGMAFWAQCVWTDTGWGWECVHTAEMTPAECLHTVRGVCESRIVDAIIVEEFKLYPGKAEQQAFSQLQTSQLIGGIKATWGWYGNHTELVEQSASIKKPAKAIARAKKYRSTARRQKTGDHCVDAEVHGFYYTHKTLAERAEKARQ